MSPIEKEKNYMIKGHSAFIYSNPNVKCFSMLINIATLHNNTLPLIIMNNLDNKGCIPKDILMGTSEAMSNDHYNINEIALVAKSNNIKTCQAS